MKINRVEGIPLKTGPMLVRVHTDEGISGIGECSGRNWKVLKPFIDVMDDDPLTFTKLVGPTLDDRTGSFVARRAKLHGILLFRENRAVCVPNVAAAHRPALQPDKTLAVANLRGVNVHNFELLWCLYTRCFHIFPFLISRIMLQIS